MKTFKAPYRITTVFDRLKAKTQLSRYEITVEELSFDEGEEAGYFPRLQYDTARVFIRDTDGRSINVHGVLQDGHFQYRAAAYDAKGSPWGSQYFAPMDKLPELIDFVMSKFASLGQTQ